MFKMRPRQNERGITLLEVPFALALIAMAGIGAFGLFTTYRTSFEQRTIHMRLVLSARSMMSDIAMYYYAGGVLPLGEYNWAQDATHFNFTSLLTDNQLQTANAQITISVPTSGDYHTRIVLMGRDGRSYTIERVFFVRLR